MSPGHGAQLCYSRDPMKNTVLLDTALDYVRLPFDYNQANVLYSHRVPILYQK